MNNSLQNTKRIKHSPAEKENTNMYQNMTQSAASNTPTVKQI